MVQVVITDADYTFDASAKTITLSDPYHALNLGQIYQIKNLTTEANIYNSTEVKFPISISSDVITHTYDSEGMTDSDKLQIIVDLELFVHDTHLKVLGYHESIGHLSTNSDLTIERALGRKTAIGTGAFTLLEDQPYVQPPGDVAIYIQSSSANDAAAGSGAQQVTIEYYPFAWDTEPTVITTTLDGTNQVDMGVSDFHRMHKMNTTRGSSSAGGDITITNQAASILYGQITQYTAFMQRCIFYVGTGQKVTCTEGIFGASTTGGVIGRLFASEEDASGNVVSRARITFEVADSQITYPFQISETVSNPNGKRIAIGLAVAGKVANQTGTGSLKGFGEAIETQ